MLTLIDPIENLYRTETKLEYPLDNSKCGYTGTGSTGVSKHYFTKFILNNLNISRLYHYANCRILDSTPLIQDNGTTIQTACAAIKNYGAASEPSYPYNISVFSKFPPLSIYQGAKYFRTFSYTFVAQNLTSIKNCLNTYNVPVIFGFLVYSSFMTNTVSTTGIVTTPNTTKEKLLGGHCMTIVGYNDTTQMFTCANSWGTSWGNKGYCTIPYNYLLNSKLAMDFCFTQFVY
jgi:hypothetical protein